MSGYAYQMNAALDKIKEMMRVNAELRKEHDDLVLENNALRLVIEDLKRLNAKLPQSDGQPNGNK